MRRIAPLLALALTTCAGAPEPETTVSVSVSALALTGVGDVVWDIQVRNGAIPSEVVWSRRVASSRFGDGKGSALWVGPCDASPSARNHTVDVWVVGLYDAPVTSPGEFASGQTTGPGAVQGSSLPFVNPSATGPLTRSALCQENADTLVDFDVSLMRPAQQGFFDVAVNLTSVFCSAKFDCCDTASGACPGDGSLDHQLLFQADGTRGSTFVLGFACAAEPGLATDTLLYMDTLQLDCTSPDGDSFSADITLDPSGPPGNQCIPGSLSTCDAVTELAGTDADSVLFQFATYRGLESLVAEVPIDKVYWNLALGVKRPTIADCRLRLRASADDAAATPLVSGGRVTAGVVYPYIQWDVDLGSCGAEPLSYDGSSMVSTRYTTLDGPGLSFAHGYGSGQTAGPFCTPLCQHGECVGGTCLCPAGYSGTACEVAPPPPDPCLSNPCQNGGTCLANGAAFTCTCTGEFTGPTCADPVVADPCLSNPCQNGGTCLAEGAAFTCNCPAEFTGPTCADPVIADPCLSNPCQNGGTCLAEGATFTCTCPPEFTGPTCDEAVATHPCDNSPCVNGTCVPVDQTYYCACPPTHVGQHCDLPVTACMPNPCQNGGTCTIAPGGFTCECTAEYGGLTCETELPCGLQEGPCAEGSFCTAAGVCLPDGTTPNDDPVTASPPGATLLPGGTEVFTLSEGNAPYTVSTLSGGGELDYDPDTFTATFTAPDEPGATTLRVTDAFGATVDIVIDTTAPLGLTPLAVEVSSTTELTAHGGLGPYTLTNLGPGTLVNSSYTAPIAPTTTTIRVTDSLGHMLETQLTVHAPLAISPSSVSLATNSTTAFSATGGFGSTTFSVTAGQGSFSGSTYTAPATAGSATVTVTDQLGHTSAATVAIYPPLVITPSTPTVEVNKAVVFFATGGQGAYTFTRTSGNGSVSGSTYTAPGAAGSATVQVADSVGNTKTATITIIAALTDECAPNPCLNGGLCVLDAESETGYVCECAGEYSGDNCEVEPPPCGTSPLPCDPGYFCTVAGVCLPDGTTPNPTPLTINPATAAILVSGTRTFSATGGNPPYTFALGTGDGTVTGSTFTAPAYATTSTVVVRDAFGFTSTATVDIRPALQISPAATTIAVNGSATFSATGGIGSYTYTRPSGGGTLTGTTYTAPSTTGTAIVRVTDSAGNRSDAAITIANFAILPTNPSVQTDGTLEFSTSGGTAPYAYVVLNGGGSFAGSTFTAPSTAQTSTVRVTSANGWTASTTVTTYAPLSISPASPLVMAGHTQAFTSTGGSGTPTFAKVSGDGTLVGSTFTAPTTPGTAIIRATDKANNTADATVTIYPVLELTPAESYVLSGETVTFSATGGYGAHTYSVLSGGGTFSGSTYTASGSAGPSLVRVTDSLGNTASATVTVFGYTIVAAGGVSALTAATTFGHSCGLRSDGTLWCWGSNTNGQLGDGSTTARTFPIRVGVDSDWRHVATGDTHTCATRTDGTLWCWGNNGANRLGDGTGTNRLSPVKIGNDTDWFMVAAGNTHTCAVKTTGTLWCWGANASGQLGTGNTTARTTPFQVGNLTTWSQVTTTRNNATCATQTDGSLWCWGLNTTGVLGQGNTTLQNSPVRVATAIDTWSTVAGGHGHVCATRTDGTLWCWGRNTMYQSGDSTTTNNKTTPFQVGAGLGPWTEVSAGAEFSCGISQGSLYCWGRNINGQIGDGTVVNRNTPTRVGLDTDWVKVAAGPEHACASKVDGTLRCWGWNAHGQLGSTGTATVVKPVRVLTDTTGIAASEQGHSCATRADGTAWCWGWNASHYMLGDGTTVNKTRPVMVVGGHTNWTFPSDGFGRYHTCAHRSDGKLACWGRSYYGALGSGSTTTAQAPVEVLGGAVWYRAALGYYHSCGVRMNGTMWCWGYNGYGQHGTGTTSSSNFATPLQVGTLTTWSDVAAGRYYTCGIRTDGSLWCWGRNNSSQLGDNSTTTRSSPTQVGDASWLDVGTGDAHTCGIQADGSLWCWGSGTSGRLGNGSTATQRVPVLTDSSLWSEVSLGYASSCGIKSDGSLWCWGANTYGQLGVGDLIGRTRPTRVGGDNDWAEISAGQYHTCARKSDGQAFCWGRNQYGQIGSTDKCADLSLFCQTSPEPVH